MSDRAQARNDDNALVELYRREFGGLLRLAFSMTSSESASEEIVQDAFVKLQSAGNGVTNPAAYVRTTVVNACCSHHRHLAVVRRAPAPRSVAYEAQHDELFDAVAALPWRQQAVLALRFHLSRGADWPQQSWYTRSDSLIPENAEGPEAQRRPDFLRRGGETLRRRPIQRRR